jgi:hypothetical protein
MRHSALQESCDRGLADGVVQPSRSVRDVGVCVANFDCGGMPLFSTRMPMRNTSVGVEFGVSHWQTRELRAHSGACCLNHNPQITGTEIVFIKLKGQNQRPEAQFRQQLVTT